MRNSIDRVACKNLDRLTGVHLYLYDAALGGFMQARSLAAAKRYRTGHYYRSIYFEGTRGGGRPAHASFGATDFKAWWIEYGAKGGRFKAHHIMEAAAKIIGLRRFKTNHGGRRPALTRR